MWGRSWRKTSFYWRKIGRAWTILRGRCWWKSSFYWKKIGRTWTNFHYISKFSAMRTAGGRCVRKWRFSKEETAFAGVQFFFRSFHFIFSKKWTAGGDASENGDFQREKQRLQGSTFFDDDNDDDDDILLMLWWWCKLIVHFLFWNLSSFSNHFVKWYSPNFFLLGSKD